MSSWRSTSSCLIVRSAPERDGGLVRVRVSLARARDGGRRGPGAVVLLLLGPIPSRWTSDSVLPRTSKTLLATASTK